MLLNSHPAASLNPCSVSVRWPSSVLSALSTLLIYHPCGASSRSQPVSPSVQPPSVNHNHRPHQSVPTPAAWPPLYLPPQPSRVTEGGRQLFRGRRQERAVSERDDGMTDLDSTWVTTFRRSTHDSARSGYGLAACKRRDLRQLAVIGHRCLDQSPEEGNADNGDPSPISTGNSRHWQLEYCLFIYLELDQPFFLMFLWGWFTNSRRKRDTVLLLLLFVVIICIILFAPDAHFRLS